MRTRPCGGLRQDGKSCKKGRGGVDMGKGWKGGKGRKDGEGMGWGWENGEGMGG